MKPLILGGDWLDPKGTMDFPEDLDIVMAVDVEPTRKELRPGVKKVMCCFFEPRGTRLSNDYIISKQDQFELILTCDHILLEKCKKAVMFPFGMTWINKEDWEVCQTNKKFFITMICGGKNSMQGHRFRQEVWAAQDKIKTPKTFYKSAVSTPPGFEMNPPLLSDLPSKRAAFIGAMYHICIENACDKNYFSEKLMDCFVTKTVPIYWGCENIFEYFDYQGMIICSGPNHVIYEANNVSPAKYERMMPHIEENFKRAQQYVRPMAERVQEVIFNYVWKMNPLWKAPPCPATPNSSESTGAATSS